jgi:hypothetical protein
MENSISSSQTELAQSIYDSFIENNKTCSGAPQQQVNGAYRMFELLYLISMELDYTGNWNDFTSSILSDYETFNSNASGAPQQLVNGLYRSVEISAVIAYEVN